MKMGTTRLRRGLLALLTCGLLGRAAGAAPPGMVWIPGGTFLMGEEGALPEERPVHEVEIDGFFMDRHEVTNRRFLAFVRATGYLTRAERPGRGGEPPGSLVFVTAQAPVSRGEIHRWWRFVPGVSWRHPAGPRSDLSGRWEHPVVHVAWEDAAAFCAWAGGRLPTEAEWERAARGGLSGKIYTWGDEERPGGRFLANTWQGPFPTHNRAADGWTATAPVGSYPANRYGLHDMAGNVWEWTSDWYRHDYYTERARKNPRGPQEARSLDPGEPGVRKRTTRGGSFLCAASHCMRYRPSARAPVEPGTSLSHTGFRCVRDPDRRAREPARP